MAPKSPKGFAENPEPFDGPARVKVGPDGRILIPASLRKAAGFTPGQTVIAELRDGSVTLTTFDAQITRLQAAVAKYRKPAESVVDELIAERRAEAAKEDAETEEWLALHKDKDPST